MKALSPLPPKRPQSTPLMWAGGGTLMLHGAFFLVLWLWPYAPAKPRETLLEVDLKPEKPAKVTLQPTERPTESPKPTEVPTATEPPKPTSPPPTEQPRPTPRPRPVREPRRNRLVPTAVPEPTPIARPTLVAKPTPLPRPTVDSRPTPVPTVKSVRVVPTPAPTASKKVVVVPTTAPTAPQSGNPKPPARSSALPNQNPKPVDDKPSGGGNPGRRYSMNDEGGGGAPRRGEREADKPSPANKGSNNSGKRDETAGGEPSLNLPRSSGRRGGGRRSNVDAPPGSAPTKSKDETEVNTGPSMPTGGGSRRMAAALGSGANDDGPVRSGGIRDGEGGTKSGNSRAGRGADEAPGDGIGSGSRGAGTRGSTGSGRTRGRVAGDPFGTTNGRGGTGGSGNGRGIGNGDGDGSGSGNGPGRGTRLARRGLGEGDAGDGDGRFGSGGGRGNGNGNGVGDGSGRGNPRSGRGDGDSAGGDSPTTGGNRTRARRDRDGGRARDTENQMGRGIWGGFKMSFYQDKSHHPDLPDATFHPGNPIDWPVFSKLVKQEKVPNLDFNWGETPPVRGMKSTFWSMKAIGRIFVPKDDDYEFFFDELDDAGSLKLDGKTIIKVWQVQKSSPSSGSMFLTRGPHDIEIQYIQGPATEASVKLSWRSKTFPREIVGVYQAPEE